MALSHDQECYGKGVMPESFIRAMERVRVEAGGATTVTWAGQAARWATLATRVLDLAGQAARWATLVTRVLDLAGRAARSQRHAQAALRLGLRSP